ncbi:bifunctional precorrin-2 dehydrogenase/sirohydrochlorin ferrochelatase [bacterium]|nr:MAG: bifunctional precorrin-2 dehydrogenase/sirohydrochlorin ferrochelatase [bacterium]
MKVLPVAIAIENRPVLVVGGGTVAARKVAALMEAGALVTVIAPELAPDFPSPIQHHPRRFEPNDCAGFQFVFAATDSREVNAAVAADARQHHALLNDASAPENSDFHTQAIVRRGPITLGLSTEGASPAVSAHLRREIESLIGPEWEALFALIAETNAPARSQSRAALWKWVLASPLLDLLREGKSEEAKAQLKSYLDKSDAIPTI